MYDELIEALRLCVKYGKAQDALENAGQAADAIEELQEDNAALNGTISNLIQQIEELSKRIPVPPHGRLIDADALYERAKMRSERFNGCFNDLDNVINALYIETFPTIIPAEEGE